MEHIYLEYRLTALFVQVHVLIPCKQFVLLPRAFNPFSCHEISHMDAIVLSAIRSNITANI